MPSAPEPQNENGFMRDIYHTTKSIFTFSNPTLFDSKTSACFNFNLSA